MTNYRGVAYDTGTNFATGQGELSRNVWSDALMQSEIDVISSDLNCNSVTVFGTDLDRLTATATAAVDRGLHVYLQPRLVEGTQQEILDHLAEGARLAESLRGDGALISFGVGAVQLIFTPGLIEGGFYHERMANVFADANHFLLHPTAQVDPAAAAPLLNEFLGKAAAVARANFEGEVGYSAAPFEDVDWDPFDFVGIQYHWTPKPRTREGHLAFIDGYRKWNKPIRITEYGTATYTGAEQKAFFVWDIADRSGEVPTIVDGYVRDEAAQAGYHRKMLELFETAGVDGVTVSELIHPTHPHSPDPRYDLDMASMAVLKTIRDDFSDVNSTYRWEKKESFHAIADHYARAVSGNGTSSARVA
ncbi:hypothetical protein [Amycolatopsis sp. cmx-4-54]|uniref:hypothetical protein n=1 Tax=Amycolatopsis sp. cmx-4-54 TaxID=2790936 RepID=UPI00397B6563